jgi:bacteriorhodopsin
VLAYCVERTGSYRFAFYLLSAAVMLLAVVAALVPLPAGAERA